jgi:hypothetical protein
MLLLLLLFVPLSLMPVPAARARIDYLVAQLSGSSGGGGGGGGTACANALANLTGATCVNVPTSQGAPAGTCAGTCNIASDNVAAPTPVPLGGGYVTVSPGTSYGGYTVAGNGTTDDTAALAGILNQQDILLEPGTYLVGNGSGSDITRNNANLRCDTKVVGGSNAMSTVKITTPTSGVQFRAFIYYNGGAALTVGSVMGCTIVGPYGTSTVPNGSQSALSQGIFEIWPPDTGGLFAENYVVGMGGNSGSVNYAGTTGTPQSGQTFEWNVFNGCDSQALEIDEGQNLLYRNNTEINCTTVLEQQGETCSGCNYAANITGTFEYNDLEFPNGTGYGQSISSVNTTAGDDYGLAAIANHTARSTGAGGCGCQGTVDYSGATMKYNYTAGVASTVLAFYAIGNVTNNVPAVWLDNFVGTNACFYAPPGSAGSANDTSPAC